MPHDTELIEVSDIREIATLMVNKGSLSPVVVDAGRDMMEAMFHEAEEYGFSKTDVVRAVLGPVLHDRREGCGCFTCKIRPSETGSADPKGPQQMFVTSI